MSSPISNIVPSITLTMLLLASVGCREDVASPTEPAGEMTEASGVPAGASAPLPFVQVTVGAGHTCGVTSDSRAYCWGRNEMGQLGDGTTTGRAAPRAVVGGLRFRIVSAGDHYTCGITTDDRAFCWGSDGYGTLGNGPAFVSVNRPKAVAGGRRYRQLGTGSNHVCGVTLTNVAYCWGDNSSGQLGTGPGMGQEEAPVPVQAGGLVFRQVQAGGNHSCGLTQDNKVWCWGSNAFGQLGNGGQGGGPTPQSVAGGLSFTQLSLGSFHTCGVTTDGVGYCWGRNAYTVGDGTAINRLTPTRVAGGLRWRGISASFSYTCGVTVSNDAYCWGSNSEGQLGDGTFGPRKFQATPHLVSGGHRFDRIAGFNVSGHSCGITTGERAYCWGNNQFGQVGDGTRARRLRPVAVVGP